MAKRSVDKWLDQYGVSHKHPVNKIIHWICVPLILYSLMALLAQVPSPLPPPFNWAYVILGLGVLYYLILSIPLAVGMVAVSALVLALIPPLDHLHWPVWLSAAVIFAGAWLGQFIGHAIEGKKPSFFKDVQFLMIGPLWLLAALYRRLGIHY